MGHYSKQETAVSSMDELATLIGPDEGAALQRVAILAGHYYLEYDEMADALLPAIIGITDDPELNQRFETITGSFPRRSFEEGMQLLQALRARSSDVKIVLLANDHVFHTKNFQRQNVLARIAGRSKELRASYYKGSSPVPAPYASLVQAAGLSLADVFYAWRQPDRNPQSTLPVETYVLSEQHLDKSFKRKTAKNLVKEGVFVEILENGERSLNFCSKASGDNICVMSGRTSGCFGVAFELLKSLVAEGTSIIVMFLPPDCIDPCIEAAEVLASIHDGGLQIVIVAAGSRDATLWKVVSIESYE